MEKLGHIDIEVTKACNLGCVHCSAEAGKGKVPDLETIKKVLKEAKSLGLKRIGITGGEPFLFPKELFELIDFSYDKLDCPSHIHTNGIFVCDNLKELEKRRGKLENITLSLLGDRKTHDLNCGLKGIFDKIVYAAEKISHLDIPLTIFLIPLSNNIDGLSSGVRQVYEAGGRRFRIMRLSSGGRAQERFETLKPRDNQIRIFANYLKDLGKELRIEFEAGYCTRLLYPQLKKLNKHESCMSGINRLHINAEGYVFPCTASSGFIEMNVGNIYERSIKDTWVNSDKLNDFRDLSSKNCRVQQHYRKRYSEKG